MSSPKKKAMQQLKWRASALLEDRKLQNSPTCKLAGSGSPVLTRTRTRRAQFSSLSVACNDETVSEGTPGHPKKLLFVDPLICTPVSTLTDCSVSGSSSSSRKTPPETRVIVETESLSALIKRHSCCPKCGSPVKVSFISKMIASTIRIDCVDRSCGFVDLEKPTAASPELPEGSRNIKRNSDAAVNILLIRLMTNFA